MNSQQELLDAINTIIQSKDKSCDTPATVIRVEGDTVWVHIDGGADETPVQKTINCAEGETVQVRISNGSAFLVGNASAPPTDDKTANVAHFIAEEADIKAVRAENTATEAQETAEEAMTAVAQSLTTYETWYMLSATTPTQPTEESHTGWSTVEPAWSSSSTDNLYFSVRTVKGDGTATWSAVGMVQSYADLQILKNAIISTVASEYVAQGDSNVTELSSTMYQNVNGVNIYNNELAVGDSYAHIDGDSFDIKVCTTAGEIDDTNDEMIASFGQAVTVGSRETGSTIGYQSQVYGSQCEASGRYSHAEGSSCRATNNYTHAEGNASQANGYASHAEGFLSQANGYASHAEGNHCYANGDYSHASGDQTFAEGEAQFVIGRANVPDTNDAYVFIIGGGQSGTMQVQKNILEVDWIGNVLIDGNIQNMNGVNKTPTILTSPTISASTTSYTFSNSAIKITSAIDVYDTIFGFAPTNMSTSTGICTITFPAQSSSHQIKLFIY